MCACVQSYVYIGRNKSYSWPFYAYVYTEIIWFNIWSVMSLLQSDDVIMVYHVTGHRISVCVCAE